MRVGIAFSLFVTSCVVNWKGSGRGREVLIDSDGVAVGGPTDRWGAREEWRGCSVSVPYSQ